MIGRRTQSDGWRQRLSGTRFSRGWLLVTVGLLAWRLASELLHEHNRLREIRGSAAGHDVGSERALAGDNRGAQVMARQDGPGRGTGQSQERDARVIAEERAQLRARAHVGARARVAAVEAHAGDSAAAVPSAAVEPSTGIRLASALLVLVACAGAALAIGAAIRPLGEHADVLAMGGVTTAVVAVAAAWALDRARLPRNT